MKLEDLRGKIDLYFNSDKGNKNMEEYFNKLEQEEIRRLNYVNSGELDKEILLLKRVLRKHEWISINTEYDWMRLKENGLFQEERELIERVEDCIFSHPNFPNQDYDESQYKYFLPENYVLYNGVIFEQFFGQGVLTQITLDK